MLLLQLSATGLFHAFGFAATKSTKTSSGSSTIFFILLIAALGLYLWIRPQRRKMRQQQLQQSQYTVGDEVVTTSGIIGTIQASYDNDVELEIAPGTVIRVVRQAISRRYQPITTTNSNEPPKSDADEDHDHVNGTPEATDSSKWWPQASDKPDDHSGDKGSTGVNS